MHLLLARAYEVVVLARRPNIIKAAYVLLELNNNNRHIHGGG